MKPKEAIAFSKKMMYGNRWKLFMLQMWLLGWTLLAAFFTLGIGFLWVIPYQMVAMANFYDDLKTVDAQSSGVSGVQSVIDVH
jgi:uncharacterized membrane protein